MNHRFACLMATGLALAAGPRAVMSASPVRHSVADLDILVDGVPEPRYAHDRRWYVEARKGREYAIRLHSPYAVRVAVALSVGGLNTIDARETTAADARKWVLGHPQLVRLGILPPARTADPLQRRERARGFDPGFCPEPPRLR